ncbi:chemotaxis protein CheW [Treponema sp. OMZ 840]|uniref:CheR family methyltransferase n=1 Tax=Treponema sp. OMZ 840 TaxID=244313 RepID=UPI003D930D8F
MEKVLESVLDMQVAEEAGIDKKEQIVNIDFKMVTFSLAGKEYAIDILKIKEIAKAGRFTYVPNSAPFVIGVYNLRGEIIPIIDLRLFFNIPVPERSAEDQESIIIVSFGEQKYGIVVDRIDRVVGIQSSTIQPPHPLFGDINIKYIYGVVENADRLYILLDIDRIFGIKGVERYEPQDISVSGMQQTMQQLPPQAAFEPPASKTEKAPTMADVFSAAEKDRIKDTSQDKAASASAASSAASVSSAPSSSASAKAEAQKPKEDPEFSFVAQELASFKKFYLSDINEHWVHKRYAEWKNERTAANVQILNADDADAFLSPFYSRCTGSLWTNEYAEAIYAVLPENHAKQIYVWNPGCGAGYEAYSLACLLKKRYPDAKIRIYAQDTDLLAVSNAPLMLVQKSPAFSWYDEYLSQTVSGEWTFAPDIKDTILFEYHDCTHSNPVSQVDLIFARDFLSFVPEANKSTVLEDFYEKIRGNGFVVVGDNEVLADRNNWFEVMKDTVITYTKQ